MPHRAQRERRGGATPPGCELLAHGTHLPPRPRPSPLPTAPSPRPAPQAPGNEGYRVDCAPDGSGTMSFCSDRTCGSCAIRTPFSSEVCAPNPPQFGSSSVAIRCPGTPPAPLVPFVAANGGVRGN